MSILIVTCISIIIVVSAFEHYRDLPLESSPFSLRSLVEARSMGRPVIVVLVANWDPVSILQESEMLNGLSAKRFIRQHAFVVLRADRTKWDPVLERFLEENELNSRNGILVYSVVGPRHPYVIDSLDEKELLGTLQQAVKVDEEQEELHFAP
jgi:thiol:disulfide interchange protein